MRVYNPRNAKSCEQENKDLSAAVIISNDNHYADELMEPDMIDFVNKKVYGSPRRSVRLFLKNSSPQSPVMRKNQLIKKRTRVLFSQSQINRLETEFAANCYPDKNTRIELANALEVEPKKVYTWFANRRQKYKKVNKTSGRRMKYGPKRQRITHQLDSTCPTCLLPVHYRYHQDGTWTYDRTTDDHSNYQSVNDAQQTLHQPTIDVSLHPLHQQTFGVQQHQHKIDKLQPMVEKKIDVQQVLNQHKSERPQSFHQPPDDELLQFMLHQNSNDQQLMHQQENDDQHFLNQATVDVLESVHQQNFDQQQVLHQHRIDSVENVKVEEGYLSDDYDSVLYAVEQLCK